MFAIKAHRLEDLSGLVVCYEFSVEFSVTITGYVWLLLYLMCCIGFRTGSQTVARKSTNVCLVHHRNPVDCIIAQTYLSQKPVKYIGVK